MSKIRLSSKLTFIYKYLIPGVFTLLTIALLFNLFLNFFPQKNTGDTLPMFCSILFITGIFHFFLLPLKHIHYNKKWLFTKGFKSEKISNRNVLGVKRHLFLFFKIKYFDENKNILSIKFLPSINQSLMGLITPETIKQYRKLISKNK